MAIFNSLQYANYVSANPLLAATALDERITDALFEYGKLRLLRFDFTSPAGMVAADIVNLVRLPQGKVTVLSWLSQVRNGAFGAGLTLSLGWAAYKDKLQATVAANATGLLAATSVAAAGTLSLNPAAPASGFLGSGITGPAGVALQSFESLNGVVLQGTFAGGSPASAQAVTGALVIAVE
jgi:hypothetical protein